MVGVGILLILVAVVLGIAVGTSEGMPLIVIFCIMFFFIGVLTLGISVESDRDEYYEKRIPDLKQLLDNYEVQRLEQEILDIKEDK